MAMKVSLKPKTLQFFSFRYLRYLGENYVLASLNIMLRYPFFEVYIKGQGFQVSFHLNETV